MSARPFATGFTVGSLVGAFAGAVIFGRLVIRRTNDELSVSSHEHLQRLLDEQFAENINNMLKRSEAVRALPIKERTEKDLMTTIDMYVTPYTRITIFGKDYAAFSGRGKACLVPMDKFRVIRKNREEVLEQHGLLACVRPRATDGDSAYSRAKVLEAFDACLPDRKRRE